jgi:hypothetical protein
MYRFFSATFYNNIPMLFLIMKALLLITVQNTKKMSTEKERMWKQCEKPNI